FAPPKGKDWKAEYAIYYYALASYSEGLAKDDEQLLTDALVALTAEAPDNQGFLARTKGGKSRLYADALVLKGNVEVALKKFDAPTATFSELYQTSLTTPIGVRFSYEAKIGPGRIAEKKGDTNAAEAAYDAAAAAIEGLLDQPLDPCSRRELGRLYAEARNQ